MLGRRCRRRVGKGVVVAAVVVVAVTVVVVVAVGVHEVRDGSGDVCSCTDLCHYWTQTDPSASSQVGGRSRDLVEAGAMFLVSWVSDSL